MTRVAVLLGIFFGFTLIRAREALIVHVIEHHWLASTLP